MKRTMLIPVALDGNAEKLMEFCSGTLQRGITKIILVTVLDTSGMEGPIIVETIHSAEENLTRLSEQVRDEGIAVKIKVLTGAVSHEVLNYAKKQKVDVIVCQSSAKQPLTRLFAGSLSEDLVFGQKAPTLLLRDDMLNKCDDLKAMAINWSKKLIVPVDYSATCVRAIMQCTRFEPEAVGEVVLLHVIQKVEKDESLQQYALEDKFRLSAFCKMLEDVGVKATPVVRHGESVGQEVLKEVHDSACTGIVMGAKDRGIVTQILSGSTTMKLVSESPIPVMVVR